MTLYPQNATRQGACPNFLLFRCFHLKFTFESLKEVRSALDDVKGYVKS
jgi:hypothetical protein